MPRSKSISRKKVNKLGSTLKYLLISLIAIGSIVWVIIYIGRTDRPSRAQSTTQNRPWMGVGIANQASNYTKQDIDELGDIWVYDWISGKRPNQPIDLPAVFGDRYVPMQWGCSTTAFTQWMDAHPDYSGPMLIFNEPDDPGQANCSPAKGADTFKTLSDLKKNKNYKVKFILGGVLNGTGWMDQFILEYRNKYSTDPDIAGIHFHIYPFAHEFNGEFHNVDKIVQAMTTKLETWDNWLDQPKNQWASKGEVWVTEFGWLYEGYNSNKDELNLVMSKFTDRLMQDSRLDRVAWFTLQYIKGWEATSLMTVEGERTTSWGMYKKLCDQYCPGNNTTPTPTKGLTPTPTLKPTSVPTGNPVQGNILKNGNFDMGESSWNFYTNGSGKLSAQEGYAKVQLITNGSNTQFFQSGFLVEPVKKYTLRFRANSQKQTKMGVYLHRHDGGYENIGVDVTENLSVGWKNYEYEFITKNTSAVNNARLRFWFVDSANDNIVSIDDVSIIPGGKDVITPTVPMPTPTLKVTIPATPTPTIKVTLAPTPTIKNTVTPKPTATPTVKPTTGPVPIVSLIRNGSFESGALDWDYYSNGQSSFSVQGSAYAGQKKALIQVTQGGNNVQLYQHGFVISPNKKYRLQFFAKANKAKTIEVFIHRHGSPYELLGLSASVSLTTDWKVYSYEFNSLNSAKVSDARLRFWLPSLSSNDTLEIDAVSLFEL